MNKPELIKEAKIFGIDTEGLTVPELETAIAKAKAVPGEVTDSDEVSHGADSEEVQPTTLGIKVVTEGNETPEEATVFNPIEYTAESGIKYLVMVSKFRFKGNEYDAASVVDQSPSLIEDLIKVNSFIIKKVK